MILRCPFIASAVALIMVAAAAAFRSTPSFRSSSRSHLPTYPRRFRARRCRSQTTDDHDDDNDKKIIEQVRRQVLTDRRQLIRGTLKSAEFIRHVRMQYGWVPQLDPATGRPVSDDGQKAALSLTAFGVAVGAIVLRMGGRATLVSALGMDMVQGNTELQAQLEQIFTAVDSTDLCTKLGLFTLAWTAVKVLCFDAGGIALALSAGILFDGILRGAVMSATAATIGSSVAFALAKLDTPVRRQALTLLDDIPSLRGVEKVVANDGFKAILTLRLAPILPIPIGMYNYVYGVTNVPYLDFAGGIFLGSLKPYLLDSYVGYFGKSLMDGTASSDPDNNWQDTLLLVALAVSVLIGVFASQLATETWDAVVQEVEADENSANRDPTHDGITRQVLGIDLPDWIVGFQLNLQAADERVKNMVQIETVAQVWNYTDSNIPDDVDPAKVWNSPEVLFAHEGNDIGADICNGLVLPAILFGAFTNLADPYYNATAEAEQQALVHAHRDRQALRARIHKLRAMAEARMAAIVERLAAATTQSTE